MACVIRSSYLMHCVETNHENWDKLIVKIWPPSWSLVMPPPPPPPPSVGHNMNMPARLYPAHNNNATAALSGTMSCIHYSIQLKRATSWYRASQDECGFRWSGHNYGVSYKHQRGLALLVINATCRCQVYLPIQPYRRHRDALTPCEWDVSELQLCNHVPVHLPADLLASAHWEEAETHSPLEHRNCPGVHAR